MKLKTILIILAVATAAQAGAERRSEADIFRAASGVLFKAHPGESRSPSNGRKLQILNSRQAYSVVGIPDGPYAIVANDDMLPEILGYSSDSFSVDSDCPGFNWWLQAISETAERIVANGAPVTRIAPDPSRFASAVPQLLTDQWGQMGPYNDLCPEKFDASGNSRGRSVVGCVATSASQVMRYHKYPPKGEGIHINMQTVDAFGNPMPLKVDYDEFSFDYSKMRDKYYPGQYSDDEAAEAAKLCYAAGVAFGMIYDPEFSGTYTDSCAVGLREHLRYYGARHLKRGEYGPEQWMNLIFKELSESRPVLYAGADPFGKLGGGGHAFVFDGYDSKGLVHVNWGWYGRHDGYYEVSLLNPSTHTFTEQQDMIIGVAPPETQINAATVTFSGVVSLTDVEEAVESSVYGDVACLDLSAATLPGDEIPDFLFANSGLTKIILPDNLVSIGIGAFANCRKLREVVFPQPDTRRNFIVEDGVVYSKDKTQLLAVMPYFGNDVNFSGDYHSLLVIPEGVRTICDHALDGCFRIKGVELPSTLTWIGEEAFSSMSCLRRVKLHSVEPADTHPRAFATIDPAFSQLYVPAGSSDIYSRNGIWQKFYSYDNVFEYGTTVKANNYTRACGEQNPAFDYRVYGDYVSGEPELTCDATPDSPAGDYVISVSRGSLTDPDINFVNGTLRIIGDSSDVEIAEEDAGLYEIFSVDGRKLAWPDNHISELQPGIYIINGKKIKI